MHTRVEHARYFYSVMQSRTSPAGTTAGLLVLIASCESTDNVPCKKKGMAIPMTDPFGGRLERLKAMLVEMQALTDLSINCIPRYMPSSSSWWSTTRITRKCPVTGQSVVRVQNELDQTPLLHTACKQKNPAGAFLLMEYDNGICQTSQSAARH